MDDRELFCGMTAAEWNALHERVARLLCRQHDYDWDVIAEDFEALARPTFEPTRQDFAAMADQVIRLVLRQEPLPPEHYPLIWSRRAFAEAREAGFDPPASPAYAPPVPR